MASTSSCPVEDSSHFNLKEWAAKARISRDINTINNSRRFSASSYIREDTISTRSFRSNFTISSTASSPGYPFNFKDEIDPSTYSFTTALKALQARSGYNVHHSWECSSPEGFALNSKWNEAEKYICNPLSGKVPLECLSAKTLSGRSFRYSQPNRITMSAPLVYSSTSTSTSKPSSNTQHHHHHLTLQFPSSLPASEEKKKEGMTRDVGTQSTPPYLSSSSPSPASTPPIIERSIKRSGGQYSPFSNSKTKSEEEEVEEKDKEREDTEEKTPETENKKKKKMMMNMKKKKKNEQVLRSNNKQGGCFSWMRNKRQRDQKGSLRQKKNNNNIFPTHFKGC